MQSKTASCDDDDRDNGRGRGYGTTASGSGKGKERKGTKGRGVRTRDSKSRLSGMLNLNIIHLSTYRIASLGGPDRYFFPFLFQTSMLCVTCTVVLNLYSVSPTSISLAFSTRFQGTLLIPAHPPTFNLLIVDSEEESIQASVWNMHGIHFALTPQYLSQAGCIQKKGLIICMGLRCALIFCDIFCESPFWHTSCLGHMPSVT